MIILKFKWQICIVLDLGRQANENVGDIFEFVFIICPLEIRMSTLEIELVLFKPVCLAEGSTSALRCLYKAPTTPGGRIYTYTQPHFAFART